MKFKSDSSNVWPYVIVGSAVGGAVAYLFATESGKKIRRSMTNPDELTRNIESARDFLERKADLVTGKVHSVIDKARRGIEEGQGAYRDAEQHYRSRARQIESQNDRITSGVHATVDKMSRTAVHVEHSVADPLCEMGALYHGVVRGLRTIFGRTREPISINREGRFTG
jgi:gas vesicle protein